jgi:O-antigen ligase
MDKLRGWFIELHQAFKGSSAFGALVFMVLAVPVSFSPYPSTFFETVKYSLFFFGGGLLLWSIAKNWKINLPFKRVAVVWFILLALSVVLALDPLRSLVGYYPRYNNFFFLYVICFFVFLGVFNLEKPAQKKLLEIAFFASLIVALQGILQSFGLGYYGGIASLGSTSPDRVPGLLGNPNFSSLFIAIFFPLALHRALKPGTLPKVISAWIGMFILSWALSIFASRGAIAGAILGSFSYLIYIGFKKNWQQLSLGIVLIMLVSVPLAVNLLRYRGVESSVYIAQDHSAVNRYIAWDVAGEAIRLAPVFGIGAGSFQTFYWSHWPKSALSQTYYFDDPHNLLLYLLATLGLPFTIILAVLVVLICFRILVLVGRSEDGERFALVAGLGVFTFGAMFNPIVLSIWVVAAVFLGLLATPALSPTVFKVVFKVKVLTRILALFLIVFGCSTLLAEHLLVLATNRLDKKDYQSTIRYAQIVHYLNPSLTQPLNLSALAMIREGAPVARVEQQIALATALESKSPYNYLTCAKLYYELYKNKKNLDFATRADSCFKKAMQISPGYPEFELQYGAFLLQTGYAPQAEAYIKRGIAGGGGEGNAWLLLAAWYRETGQAKQLTFALLQAYKKAPTSFALREMAKEVEKTGDAKVVQLFVESENPLKYFR